MAMAVGACNNSRPPPVYPPLRFWSTGRLGAAGSASAESERAQLHRLCRHFSGAWPVGRRGRSKQRLLALQASFRAFV